MRPQQANRDSWHKKNFFFTLLCAAALYCVFFMFVMEANPLRNETVAPVARLQDYVGWSSHTFTSPPSHPERSDILDVFLPTWITFKKLLNKGENAAWNPISLTGVPGIAELSRGALTPSFLVFLLIQPDWLGFYFAGLIKLCLAALGTFLFLSHYIDKKSSFIGGIIFALCGFNVAWFYWPQVATSAWIPWLLWASSGWLHYRTSSWLLACTLCCVFLVLGGFPVVTIYGFYAAFIFVAGAVASNKETLYLKLLTITLWGTSIVIGILLCSIPILSLKEMLSQIDLSYRAPYSSYDIPRDLILLIKSNLDTIPRVETTIYIGAPAIALSLLPFFSMKNNREQTGKNTVIISFILLLISSLIITYHFIPDSVLNNLSSTGASVISSRCAILVNFSFSILAAFGINYILRISEKLNFKLKLLMKLCLIILIYFQLSSQINLFRQFNSVSSSIDFYPPTPTLTFIKNRITPFQSIIADNSFLVSGTLGAYGFPEWLAHGFKTTAEKKVINQLINDPFQTQTASMFASSALIPDAELYARLGIRYIVFSKLNQEEILVRNQTNLEKKLILPSLNKNKIIQIFETDKIILFKKIGLLLFPLNTPKSSSKISIDIKNINNEILASTSILASDIRNYGGSSPGIDTEAPKVTDNVTIFHIDPSITLPPGTYKFEISATNPSNKEDITAWATFKPSNATDTLTINGKLFSGSLFYSLYTDNMSKLNDKLWNKYELEDNDIVLAENKLTPKGAYLITKLQEDAPWTEAQIVSSRPKADKVKVEYTGEKAGFIVVPMRYYPGWNVYVNGIKSTLQAYLGMMPAVYVKGPAHITFSYEPKQLTFGIIFMIVGFVFFVILSIFTNKYYRKLLTR